MNPVAAADDKSVTIAKPCGQGLITCGSAMQNSTFAGIIQFARRCWAIGSLTPHRRTNPAEEGVSPRGGALVFHAGIFFEPFCVVLLEGDGEPAGLRRCRALCGMPSLSGFCQMTQTWFSH